MMSYLYLLLCLFIIFVPAPVRAELFTWVDQNGGVNVTDDRDKVPANYRGQAKAIGDSNEKSATAVKPARSRYIEDSAPASVDNNGRPESYWRTRANTLRTQIQTQEESIADYYEQYLKCEESQKNIIGRGRKNCVGIYDNQKQYNEMEINKLRRKLEVELPEEARRAGALPGWIR
jgi:hypothetical protein